jgi:phosphoenolpyruvate phosphomutase
VNDLEDFRRAGDFAHAQAPFAAAADNRNDAASGAAQ